MGEFEFLTCEQKNSTLKLFSNKLVQQNNGDKLVENVAKAVQTVFESKFFMRLHENKLLLNKENKLIRCGDNLKNIRTRAVS